jgi:hypothetical protein
MKFVTVLNKGILGQADSTEMWNDILIHIPDEVLLRPNVQILNIACGHATEAVLIAKRMLTLGISKEAVQKSLYLLDKYYTFTNPASIKHGFKNVIVEDFLKWKTDMKFDVIVGNPPYQEGGQNKIYNQFSTKALALLKSDGVFAFITPIPVTRPNKRFSIVGMDGLAAVNFGVSKYFSVGISICYWVVNKANNIPLVVTNSDGSINPACTVNNIFDSSTTSKEFLDIYNGIRSVSEDLNNRMFQRNNFGPALNRKKSVQYNYPLYSNKDINTPNWYSSREPHFYGMNKFVIRLSGPFNTDAVICSTLDFDLNHIVCEITTPAELNNVKSFLFSECFVDFANKCKLYIDSKSHDILVYLPKFDKTKSWTNEEVKAFLEGFVNA